MCCTFSSLCCYSFLHSHMKLTLYNSNYCIVNKLSFSFGILLDYYLPSNLPFSANALEKAEVGLDNMILSAVLCIVREISVKILSRSWQWHCLNGGTENLRRVVTWQYSETLWTSPIAPVTVNNRMPWSNQRRSAVLTPGIVFWHGCICSCFSQHDEDN